MTIQERLDADEARVYLMFLRAHASIMRELERTLQSAVGISVTWADALTQLALADGKRMTHTRLSQRLLLAGGGGITRMVDRMAKAGLVTRRASRKDRRTSYVVLTEEGERVYQKATEVGINVVQDRFTSYMRAEETPVLREFFARVLGEDESPETGRS